MIVVSCVVIFYTDQTRSLTTTPAPSPTPVLQNTSTWKTYTNSRYGFSFKYPNTWGIGAKCDGDAQLDLVRFGPDLLKFPSTDCGTGNIPSPVMVYLSSTPPPPKSNQYFTPLQDKYLVITTGSYDFPSLTSDFTTIVSTLKLSN